VFLQSVFFVLSLTLTLLFFLYGFNHYYLLNKARRYHPPILEGSLAVRPSVSIHLPIYNEKYVIHRLVASCVLIAETYGINLVDILLIDDSDDDTVSEIDAIIAEYKKRSIQIEVFRRGNRQGFKAGALQAALERTPEDFIAIFDADFIPPADFLVRTLPYFIQDERLGIVQSRWDHLNRNYNFLTHAVAIAIDIHFLIEQTGRYAAGLFQNFNGSGGVLRKTAILETGGWQSDTLAEDLDLSYRMQLHGYQVLYLKDLLTPGEIPPTIPSFKKQQGRWACGSLRTAKKILPQLLPKPGLKFKQRLQAFIHLTGYIIYPLMTLSFLLSCLATFFNLNYSLRFQADNFFLLHEILGSTGTAAGFSIQNIIWVFLGPLIILSTIAPWISSISTLRVKRLSVFKNLTSLLILLLLGFGISISNTLEAAKALLSNRSWEFTRTPKYADLNNETGWKASNYQIALDPVWMLELVFACTGVVATGFAIWQSNFSVLLILIPFTTAYAFILFLTILQSQHKKAV
jgi:cellulose synthase/poly-beta-1,6-N-acetylglucosamine synthase-like glycosyltransferase